MNLRYFICLYFFLGSVLLNAQSDWRVGDKYLVKDGQAFFLNGVNYVPSVNWQTCLEDWDANEIDQDFSNLQSIGVKFIRWFPLWHIIQPELGKLNRNAVKHVLELFDLAEKHGIDVQLSFITGWMSGFTFLPSWADGNIFTDKYIIQGEQYLIRELVKEVKDHPALMGYDFGNEINVLVYLMKLKVSPDDTRQWMKIIYETFHQADPLHPVTNGIGTGFDQYFPTPDVAQYSDYMSNHSYPVFHRTIMLDPKLGQRTSYSSNFITSWCMMENKPVLIQETGSSEREQPISGVAKFLRVSMMSNWADGAAGYFWWGSCDIPGSYRVPENGLYLKYSVPDQQNRRLSRFEQSLGLIDTLRQIKYSGKEYQKCVEMIHRLGVGWEEQTPVCYLLIAEGQVFNEAMIRYITPYTLLKQNHVTVRLCYENRPVPADASAVVIPGFKLSAMGKTNIGKYLAQGGKVFQSYEHDFGDGLLVNDSAEFVAEPLLWLQERFGSMLAVRNQVKLKDMFFRRIEKYPGDEEVATLMTGKEHPLSYDYGRVVSVNVPVGKGSYLYFAGQLEKSLELKYNPWEQDASSELYAAICPETLMSIDNRLVEFYHKKRGFEEFILLINHEDSSQKVHFFSKGPVQLSDRFTGKILGTGQEFYFELLPAEVKVINVLVQSL